MPGPNTRSYPKIPKGTVTQHQWESEIYSNTIRDYYIYVPAQYQPDEPAALMIFQDGHTYADTAKNYRVPIVFDNLIAQGKMPVTIGLFINPGHNKGLPAPESPWRGSNRSKEYDEVSDTYGRFLLQEMIPEIQKSYNISDDPKMRAICGISSGGICAFSAAWFFPQHFHRVLSHIGSFTNIRGGHSYPSIIRKTPNKDIKVFLQDGSGDLDNPHGNWWLSNLQMEAALKFKGYNYKFAPGTGGHNDKHGASILPESLIWLWDDVAAPQIKSNVYSPTTNNNTVFLSGKTDQATSVDMSKHELTSKDKTVTIESDERETLLIIRSGLVEIALESNKYVVGPNSVAFILPGEKATLHMKSESASYYLVEHSKSGDLGIDRGKEQGGSFVLNFEEITVRNHGKGATRGYFNRATAIFPYYEMHMTTLNPGIRSHEAHTHGAGEMIIMISGETEMEIGNSIVTGDKDSVYFIESNVPHSIRNTGKDRCMYFAYQWE